MLIVGVFTHRKWWALLLVSIYSSIFNVLLKTLAIAHANSMKMSKSVLCIVDMDVMSCEVVGSYGTCNMVRVHTLYNNASQLSLSC